MSWKLKVAVPGAASAAEVEMADVLPLFKNYPEVKRNFFDDLVSSINKNKEFFVGTAIKAVAGPDEKDWTPNPWVLLVAREIEKETPFWLLFKRDKSLAGCLVALGPPAVTKYAQEYGVDDIRRILDYIIAFSNRWAISVFLSELQGDLKDVAPPTPSAQEKASADDRPTQEGHAGVTDRAFNVGKAPRKEQPRMQEKAAKGDSGAEDLDVPEEPEEAGETDGSSESEEPEEP